MTRDLKSVSTDDLRAEYLPKFDRLKALRSEVKSLSEEIEPLKVELTDRDNKKTLILNAVMAGQQALLRAAGTSEEVIAEAEAWFAAEKARKESARKAAE